MCTKCVNPNVCCDLSFDKIVALQLKLHQESNQSMWSYDACIIFESM